MIRFVDILYPEYHDPNGIYSEIKERIQNTLYFAKRYAEEKTVMMWDCMIREHDILEGMLIIAYHIGYISLKDMTRIQRVVYKTALKRALKR